MSDLLQIGVVTIAAATAVAILVRPMLGRRKRSADLVEPGCPNCPSEHATRPKP